MLLPEHPRWQDRHRSKKRASLRMEFATFCVALIQTPCQIVRSGRRLVYRLLSRNPWQGVFFGLVDRLHGRRLC